MNYKDNTPTYNVNRKIVNFKDFNPEEEKQELQKIKKIYCSKTHQTINNILVTQNINIIRLLIKWMISSIDEINDDLEAIEERYKQDTITMTVPLFIRILEYVMKTLKMILIYTMLLKIL